MFNFRRFELYEYFKVVFCLGRVPTFYFKKCRPVTLLSLLVRQGIGIGTALRIPGHFFLLSRRRPNGCSSNDPRSSLSHWTTACLLSRKYHLHLVKNSRWAFKRQPQPGPYLATDKRTFGYLCQRGCRNGKI